MSLSASLIEQFIACVGPANALGAGDDLTRYTHENRKIYVGKTPLVLKPGSTKEVSAIMKLANETETAVVPQGGHTGHVGGAVPDESGDQIVVSLERMNKIRELDLTGNLMIAEAGCVLQTIQETADENDRLFALSLASQGTCQIGGNIATNAGGTGVLAYGNARDQVLGLEVVLADGSIWNGLRTLKKDNTGYDLKNLFAGSEGTLGIITACSLILRPKPRGKAVAFAGVKDPHQALALLSAVQQRAGRALTAFELIPRLAVECTAKHITGARDPMSDPYPWYVLLELCSEHSFDHAQQSMSDILAGMLEEGTIVDAVVAATVGQQQALWHMRESIPEAQIFEGGSIKHDVSVAIHKVPEFLERAGKIVKQFSPEIRIYAFGHLGDGNIHYNLMQPEGADTNEFLKLRQPINDAVHELVGSMEGSVSAEHGIGRLKRELLKRTKDPVELAIMRRIKQALDPKNIMNPGKVL